MKNSFVSVVLCTKNSLGMLKGAIESLCNQTYRGFEVVIIDGDSTDGTQQYLQSVPLTIKLISEPDSGISDAYSKGLRHASGDIVGILSTDERYYPHSLETAVRWFSDNEKSVVCGGVCNFLNENGEEVDQYQDDFLELERHLSCEHVCSISSSFFNRKLLGDEFYYSADMETCPDYEFWARLALKYNRDQFNWFPKPIIQAFRTDVSTSFRDDVFRKLVSDKIEYLRLFLVSNRNNNRVANIDVNRCTAGIHMWACEQLSYINYKSPEIFHHCVEAFKLAPNYARIAETVQRHPLLELINGKMVMLDEPQEDVYEVVRVLDRESLKLYNDAYLDDESPLCLVTATLPWGYSCTLIPELGKFGLAAGTQRKWWLKITLTVRKGAVGVGQLEDGDNILGERIVRESGQPSTLFVPLDHSRRRIMIRSGGEGASQALLHNLAIVAG